MFEWFLFLLNGGELHYFIIMPYWSVIRELKLAPTLYLYL